MAKLNVRDEWVLVTGASAGLGRDIARQLATEHGAHVVAVARRADRLAELKTEVEQAGRQLVAVSADLTRPADVDRVLEEATRGRKLTAAILNAGITFYGHALDQTDDELSAMMETNVLSVLRLGRGVARQLRTDKTRGALMLVSSMASFSPMPWQTAYAATKAFVTSFGQGLGHELKPDGISVTVFAPGGIATEMLEISGLSKKFKPGSVGMMDSPVCARAAVAAMLSRKTLSVPGALNQMLAWSMRHAPRGLVTAQVGRMYLQK